MPYDAVHSGAHVSAAHVRHLSLHRVHRRALRPLGRLRLRRRPSPRLAVLLGLARTSRTARSRSSMSPCASASSPSTAPAPTAAAPSRRTSSSARSATPRCATSAPAAIARSMRTGRCARTAARTSSNDGQLDHVPHRPRRPHPDYLGACPSRRPRGRGQAPHARSVPGAGRFLYPPRPVRPLTLRSHP